MSHSLRNRTSLAPSDRFTDRTLSRILGPLALSDSTTPSTRTSVVVKSKSILSVKSSPKSTEIRLPSAKFQGRRRPLALSTNGSIPLPRSGSLESGPDQTPMNLDNGEEGYEEMDWDPEPSFDYSRLDEPDNAGYEIPDPLVAKDEMDWVLTSKYMRNELEKKEFRCLIPHLAHGAPNEDTDMGVPNYGRAGVFDCSLCGAVVGSRRPFLCCGGDGAADAWRSHRGYLGGGTREVSAESRKIQAY